MADIYIRFPENKGFAKAVNCGLKLTTSPLVAIANNDIKVSLNWQEVAEEVLNDPQVYSCHFRMLNYDEPFVYGEKVYLSGKERWCTSSFFVINKKVWTLYFDENYLNSYDDWDYWHTVRTAGFDQAYTDKASYQHKHSSTQIHIPEREENNKKNKEYFKEKWGDYAEDLFEKAYPEQMQIPYQEGF